MNYFFLPLIGIVIGAIGATAGIGGAVMLVPVLLFLGLAKDVAVGTSFINVAVVALASVAMYGMKGSVDWKSGLLVGVGSVVGVYLATTYIQPRLDERTFRYFFAGLLFCIAIVVLFKK